MRCDEIKERFVELLYSERGTPSANPELQAHVDSCPACRRELQELRAVQNTLQTWKDEPPMRPVDLAAVFSNVVPLRARNLVFRMARYAAIAAMVTLSFLALANAEITWDKEGFAFRTYLFSGAGLQTDRTDYYTKAETRDILKRVVDESEYRLTEWNRLMMLRMLDTIDQERQFDSILIRNQFAKARRDN